MKEFGFQILPTRDVVSFSVQEGFQNQYQHVLVKIPTREIKGKLSEFLWKLSDVTEVNNVLSENKEGLVVFDLWCTKDGFNFEETMGNLQRVIVAFFSNENVTVTTHATA